MRQGLLPATILVGLLTTGCISIGGPPEVPSGATCSPDEALIGVWTDHRVSQLGPGRVRLTLRCDCTYTMRIQLLWSRIREEGLYRVEGEELVFQRESGETRWPFELDGDRLSLEEGAGEVHPYRLASDLHCPATPGQVGGEV
jgi:hypothetical protein